MTKKNLKLLRNGSYSVVISAVVIAAVILLNMIVSQIPTKYTQFDISTGKLYTIGEDTLNVLDNLNEDITIYYIVQNGNEDTNIEKLVEQYAQNSKHIKVVKKDPVVYPNFTSQYTEESLSENSLIIECGDRNKVVAYSSIYETEFDYYSYSQTVSGFDGEGQITSAISYVTSDSLPTVYYVEGHNEVSIPSALRERIEKANIQLEALSLLTAEEVPLDAAALLLNSPESDFSTEEVEKITEYLKNGGRAMLLTDYIGKDLPNYYSLLEYYGLEVNDGIVVETDKNHYVQLPYYLVPNIGYSDVTSGMTGGSQYVLLSGSQGFAVSEDVRDTLDVSQLLTTSDGAYVKTDPQNMTTYDKEEGDIDGPLVLAASISEEVTLESEDTAGTEDTSGTEDMTSTEDTESTEDTDDGSDEESTALESSETKETRIVCFASSSILDESLNNTVADGNYTLYTNSLNWLVDSTEGTTVSIASKSMETQYLTVTAAKGTSFAILLCFLLPISCLIVGGVICYRRKRR